MSHLKCDQCFLFFLVFLNEMPLTAQQVKIKTEDVNDLRILIHKEKIKVIIMQIRSCSMYKHVSIDLPLP